jgi:hypothetical protein
MPRVLPPPTVQSELWKKRMRAVGQTMPSGALQMHWAHSMGSTLRPFIASTAALG